MANLNLMCLTWNQELADIHKKDIQPLMELIRDERPDLIVMGLQEAKPTGMFHKPSKSFAFVGEKIAANLVRDYHLNTYRFLGRQSFRGVTKGMQVLKSLDPTRSQLARQVIEVIASNPNITLSRTKYYQTKFLREKGFVFVEVQFNNRRLAFSRRWYAVVSVKTPETVVHVSHDEDGVVTRLVVIPIVQLLSDLLCHPSPLVCIGPSV